MGLLRTYVYATYKGVWLPFIHIGSPHFLAQTPPFGAARASSTSADRRWGLRRIRCRSRAAAGSCILGRAGSSAERQRTVGCNCKPFLIHSNFPPLFLFWLCCCDKASTVACDVLNVCPRNLSKNVHGNRIPLREIRHICIMCIL